MKFGIYLNPQTPGPDHDGRVIHEVLGQVDLAERLGFEYVWLTDHQFTGYNAFSEPLTLAAAISQRNPKLRIGFAVAVLPLRHPVQFATECNLIDQLSGGNFVIGIGAGNSPDEYRGYGLDTQNRHAMMNEFMAVCEKAWEANPEGFTYEGQYFNGAVRGRIIPAPIQKPRPHIAYATATPETLERIGRRGWSLLVGPQNVQIVSARLHHYYKGLDESGLDEEAKALAMRDTGLLRQLYVAAPGEDWQDTIGTNIETYLRQSARANSGIDDLPKDDFDRRRAGYVGNWLYGGTAEEIIEKLRPFAEIGLSHLMSWVTFGYMPDNLARQTLLRLASDVMPVLNQIKPNKETLERIRAGEMAGATRPSDYVEARS